MVVLSCFCFIAHRNIYFYRKGAIFKTECSPGNSRLLILLKTHSAYNFLYLVLSLLSHYLQDSPAMSSIRRNFSTTARALLQFIWKGTGSKPQYEDRIKAKLAKNPKLADADRVEIAYVTAYVFRRVSRCYRIRRILMNISGDEHTSPADPKPRVSGQVFKDNRRLTSLHAYHDGTIIYSKDSINKVQGE